MKLDLIVAITVAVLVLIFMAQNYAMVDVTFLFWSLSAPRAVLLLGVFFAGALVGWITRRFPNVPEV